MTDFFLLNTKWDLRTMMFHWIKQIYQAPSQTSSSLFKMFFGKKHIEIQIKCAYSSNCFCSSSNYSWAHLVMSMTESCRWVMQCRSRARKPRASNKGLRPCPLRTEITPVSLNLLMTLCTVDDEICKNFAIWRWGTLFLKYSTIFLDTLSQIGEPLPIFTSERLCLSKTSLL